MNIDTLFSVEVLISPSRMICERARNSVLNDCDIFLCDRLFSSSRCDESAIRITLSIVSNCFRFTEDPYAQYQKLEYII